MPWAESTAAAAGIITFSTLSCLATFPACNPAAPPKAIIVNRLGSTPRCTDISRMPSAIDVETTSEMPSAASIMGRPTGLATCSAMAFSARLVSSFALPPRKLLASRYPKAKLASVTVGRSPPLS